jgi:predicted permease
MSATSQIRPFDPFLLASLASRDQLCLFLDVDGTLLDIAPSPQSVPVILYAFSQAGLDRAVIFAAFQSFLMNSAGVYFASNSSNNLTGSLKNVLKTPVFIAVLSAIAMRILHISLPDPVLRSVEMLGQASIPTLLVVLGVQLSGIKVTPDWKFISLAAFLRLFAYPLAGLLLIPVLFVPGSTTSKVMLVLSAVPAAVMPSMLAIQYNAKPELVSASILVTTLVSIITVPLLLSFVM